MFSVTLDLPRSAASAPSAARRRTLRERLIASGIPEARVTRYLLAESMGPWGRAWRRFERLLGSDIHQQEDSLARQVAECTSHDEIIDAFREYEIKILHSRSGLWMRIAMPRLRRLLKIYGLLRRAENLQPSRQAG